MTRDLRRGLSGWCLTPLDPHQECKYVHCTCKCHDEEISMETEVLD